MSYQVLARKWRPRKFAELVGQEHVVRALTHALESGRVHHAFLFTGTRGVGKTTIARIFAKSLNCERGESAEPCGVCKVCVDVDAGRFIDLLEIDAASNTGIDNVRDLIDNAQYAPSRGRCKVYLIDEVHMLSKNAFNALLKTLEEPPSHVKFLLATTDPQKLLVTVLSRCIKFNLKRLTSAQIGGQIRHILGEEGIAFDDDSVDVLARAADGSLRDGLSLLDQAIAHGGGVLVAAEVHAMLGTVDRGRVVELLDALIRCDGPALIDEVQRIADFAPDFGLLLDELAGLLHRIQLLQLVGVNVGNDAALSELAQLVDPRDVSVWYQMATNGRRDLAQAPTSRVGFEMTLLRMLAFVPSGSQAAQPSSSRPPMAAKPRTPMAAPRMADVPVAPAVPVAANAAPAQSDVPMPAPSSASGSAGDDDDWATLIDKAGLRGPAGQLARNAVLVGIEATHLRLTIHPIHREMASGSVVDMLEQRLSAVLGRPLKVTFDVSDGRGETPAEQRARVDARRQQQAEEDFRNDPLTRSLVDDFGGRIVPQSIRSRTD